MKTVSYNKIDAEESDYLYVENSQLQSAGNGLFTAVPIFKDEMIAVFKGENLSATEAAIRSQQGTDKYFILLADGRVLDSMAVECFAKYANDASVNSDLKNNAKIAFDDDNQIGLIAIRKIKAGEEIFCSYGKKYWTEK